MTAVTDRNISMYCGSKNAESCSASQYDPVLLYCIFE